MTDKTSNMTEGLKITYKHNVATVNKYNGENTNIYTDNEGSLIFEIGIKDGKILTPVSVSNSVNEQIKSLRGLSGIGYLTNEDWIIFLIGAVLGLEFEAEVTFIQYHVLEKLGLCVVPIEQAIVGINENVRLLNRMLPSEKCSLIDEEIESDWVLVKEFLIMEGISSNLSDGGLEVISRFLNYNIKSRHFPELELFEEGKIGERELITSINKGLGINISEINWYDITALDDIVNSEVLYKRLEKYIGERR